MNIDKFTGKPAQIVALIAVLSGSGAAIDSRYASAADLENVINTVMVGQIQNLEFQILQLELHIAQLESQGTISEAQQIILATLRNTRERYLRQLESLRADG